jgi:hypothetical protein
VLYKVNKCGGVQRLLILAELGLDYSALSENFKGLTLLAASDPALENLK